MHASAYSWVGTALAQQPLCTLANVENFFLHTHARARDVLFAFLASLPIILEGTTCSDPVTKLPAGELHQNPSSQDGHLPFLPTLSTGTARNAQNVKLFH